MKIVKIQYTVKEEFVTENKANIKSMMDQIRSLERFDIRYTAYVLKDGKTFVHLAQYENTEAQDDLHNLATFKVFSRERDAHIEIAPELVEMTLVGSTFDLFTIREEHIEF
ncbi:MAG: hypothetical protein H7177_08675 [Rhizobacter sp.]|nr:hypothetical protein [Bacteriovorax sp.]